MQKTKPPQRLKRRATITTNELLVWLKVYEWVEIIETGPMRDPNVEKQALYLEDEQIWQSFEGEVWIVDSVANFAKNKAETQWKVIDFCDKD